MEHQRVPYAIPALCKVYFGEAPNVQNRAKSSRCFSFLCVLCESLCVLCGKNFNRKVRNESRNGHISNFGFDIFWCGNAAMGHLHYLSIAVTMMYKIYLIYPTS